MKNNQRIEGIGHQVKGAFLQSLGVAIGDAKLVADGKAERAIGDAKNSSEGGPDRLAGIDMDRIAGIGHQIKGALMLELGRLAGNHEMEVDGDVERRAGRVRNAAGSERDMAREADERRNASPAPNGKAERLETGRN
jgi:uncharacterized protein YjbJ (UPF0337 family)